MNASIQTKCDELVAAIRADVMASVLAKLTGEENAAPKQKANGHAARRKREKRDPRALAETVDLLGKYIRDFPGRSIEVIGEKLHIPTKELALPVKKLLAAKRIRKTGTRRATRYYPRAS